MNSASLKRILYVDDERDILDIVDFSLSQVGEYQVQLCCSGREALNLALEYRPDLILLDVMMPDMDGPETLKVLQSHPEISQCPIVFITAKVQKDEVEAYKRLGAVGVISKPFDPMLLPQQVEDIWNQWHDG